MATRDLTLPASIRLAQSMTPNEMRALKAASGQSLNDLLGGDPEDMELAPDRTQAMVYIALLRAGHDVTWEQAGDVAPDMSEAIPDPTNGASSSALSVSAGTGA